MRDTQVGEERDEMLADLEVSLLEGAADSGGARGAARAARGLLAHGRARLQALGESPRGRSALILGFNWPSRWTPVPVRDAPFFGVLLILGGVAASV